MKNANLFYTECSSDKVYHLQIEKSGSKFVVNFQYGRRGSALKAGTKTEIPVSEEEADKIFEKFLKEKTGKGYQHIEGDNEKKNEFSEVAKSSSARKEVIIAPQLLNVIEEDEVERLINDDRYLAQEKKDGERRLVDAVLKGCIIGVNKKGTEVPLPRMIIQSINDDCVLDGEIIGEILHVFDILNANGEDIKGIDCVKRIAVLNSLEFGNSIKIVETAFTTEEKRAMFIRLKKENKEGMVFKLKSSPYVSGRPASGGSQLKFKFQKSGTFVVANITKGKRSVGLQVTSPDGYINIGKCTVPPNKPMPIVGALVEIQYLYAYKGGCLFQPVYLNERHDSDLLDCSISQIVYKAEV